MPKPQGLLRWLRPQFSLRFLFCVVTLLAAGICGYIAWRRQPYSEVKIVGVEDWPYATLRGSLVAGGIISPGPGVPPLWNACGFFDWEMTPRCRGLMVGPPPRFRQISHFYRDFVGKPVLHGRSSIWDRDGHRLLLEHWEHGRRHGRFSAWMPSGQPVDEGEYVNGKKHGTWRSVGFPKGFAGQPGVVFHEFFDHGELVKRTATRYGLTSVTQFKHGQRHGPARGGHAGGARRFVGAWRHGKEHGRWRWWAADGKLTRDAVFHDGRLRRADGSLTPDIVVQNFANTPATRCIVAQLDEMVKVNTRGNNLRSVAALLESWHRIPIQVDEDVLNQAGAVREGLQNFDPRGASLRGVLALLIDAIPQRGMLIVVRNEGVLITAGESERNWRDPTGVSALLADRASPWRDKLMEQTRLPPIKEPLCELISYCNKDHNVPVALDDPKLSHPLRPGGRLIKANFQGGSLAALLIHVLEEQGLAIEDRGTKLAVVAAEPDHGEVTDLKRFDGGAVQPPDR